MEAHERLFILEDESLRESETSYLRAYNFPMSTSMESLLMSSDSKEESHASLSWDNEGN